jgi:hypothetical protein
MNATELQHSMNECVGEEAFIPVFAWDVNFAAHAKGTERLIKHHGNN